MSDVIQGSDQWFEERRGKVTASRVIDIVPGVKGAYLASRKNYIAQLVLEILTGKTAETYQSAAMARGTELEAEARIAYAAYTGAWVEQVGFINHPTIERFGASPDGLVDDEGGLEIKCPEAAQHLDTLINGTIKRDYIYQMVSGMMCTGRLWWDYVSYHPDFPEHLQLYISRFSVNESLSTEIKGEVKKLNAEVDRMLEKLKEKL